MIVFQGRCEYWQLTAASRYWARLDLGGERDDLVYFFFDRRGSNGGTLDPDTLEKSHFKEEDTLRGEKWQKWKGYKLGEVAFFWDTTLRWGGTMLAVPSEKEGKYDIELCYLTDIAGVCLVTLEEFGVKLIEISADQRKVPDHLRGSFSKKTTGSSS